MGETFGRGRLRFGRGTIGALCAALLLAACGGEGEPETGAAAADSSAPAPTSASSPADTAPADSANDPVLAVGEEGVRLFDGTSESGRPLPFGMPMDAVIATMEGARGKAERDTNSECDAGPLEFASWADGLSLMFQDGRFAGWALNERASDAPAASGGGDTVKTSSGVGLGSTRQALEAAYQVKVEESTLGTEFYTGAISGLLDGTGPHARITAMWAGVSCVFR